MKVKVSDTVSIITGKDKGKTGKVTRVYKKSGKVTVEKVNIRTKHIKKSQSAQGEKITFEAPINASNVQVVCPHCNKKVRVAYKVEKGQKKQRICRKCNESLDTGKAAKKNSKR